jgi:hypothetical protein
MINTTVRIRVNNTVLLSNTTSRRNNNTSPHSKITTPVTKHPHPSNTILTKLLLPSSTIREDTTRIKTRIKDTANRTLVSSSSNTVRLSTIMDRREGTSKDHPRVNGITRVDTNNNNNNNTINTISRLLIIGDLLVDTGVSRG